MMWHGGYGMMLIWLAVIIAVGVIVYALVSRRGNGSIQQSRHEGGTPLEILKNRYARGEITKEEFDRMKDDIESS